MLNLFHKENYTTQNENLEDCSSSNEEKINNKFNKIIFSYDENLNKNSRDFVPQLENNIHDKYDLFNVSSISPLPSTHQIKRKNKANKNLPNQISQVGKYFLMRNDSFNIPRTNSKKYNKKI